MGVTTRKLINPKTNEEKELAGICLPFWDYFGKKSCQEMEPESEGRD